MADDNQNRAEDRGTLSRREAGGECNVPPVFAARLTPYRSLGRRGFVLLMIFVGATCFISGLLFAVVGAWPVLVFSGLDVVIVWVAFRISYRSAARYEEVAIWPDELLVRQVSPAGRVAEHRFNPFWTRFLVDRHEEFGVTGMRLVTRGRELVVGSFLNPEDRSSFATAFASAFARARGA